MPVETTSRTASIALVNGETPPSNSVVVQYDTFLPPTFGTPTPTPAGQGSPLQVSYSGDAGSSIDDGYINNDSYRHSQFYASNLSALGDDLDIGAIATIANQNSLARTLAEKGPDQPAVIRLIAQNSTSGSPLTSLIPPNTQFFLESVQEQKNEKYQVVETFGAFTAFFFGQHPEVYSFSGTLLNAANQDWKNMWNINYDEFLRGTKCAERGAYVFIQYDDVMVQGYMVSSTTQMTGADDKSVPFAFQMLVINRQALNAVALLQAREAETGSLSTLEDGLLDSLDQMAQAAQGSGLPEDAATFAIMRDFMSVGAVPAAGIGTVPTDSTSVDAGTRISGRPGDPSFADDKAASNMQADVDSAAAVDASVVIHVGGGTLAGQTAADDKVISDQTPYQKMAAQTRMSRY
jgi:hypothetical protein